MSDSNSIQQGRADKNIRKNLYLTALFWFTIVNILIGLVNGYSYLKSAEFNRGLLECGFIGVAYLSHFASINILLGLIVLIITRLFSLYHLMMVLAPLLFSLQHAFVYLDKKIYQFYHFHFNGLVLNVLMTEGSWESLHLGSRNFAIFAFLVLGIITGEFLLISIIKNILTKSPKLIQKYWKKWVVAFLIIISLTLIDKFTYAICDLYNFTRITRHIKLLPLYQPMTIKRVAKKYLKIQIDRELNFEFKKEESALKYPKAPLKFSKKEYYPNIVWILTDGWRYDTLNPENTPNIWRFAQESTVYLNHFSGGNDSRFGVFSLFYGLYSYYWFQFLGERRGPVMIDALKDLDYSFKVLSSTPLTFPEFRRSIFVEVPEVIEDRIPGEATSEKDRNMLERFIKWLDSSPLEEPFFTFMFFDSTHPGFSFPESHARYHPYIKDFRYVGLSLEEKRDQVFNRYRNSVYYVDHLIGRLLQALKERELLDRTIVLISTEHGEEFWEHGHFGHCSAYNDEQVRIPLILYIPGKTPEVVKTLTSHLDVPATMLSLLGCQNDPSEYSQGKSLFEKPAHDYVVSCGWDSCAIIDQEVRIVFSTESYNVTFGEVRDSNYNELSGAKSLLNQRRDILINVCSQLQEFMK
ncbi:MAG: sulfatase-like hydrolase/transferase [Deltaproteobacteria bacterium]|nr:MAG: sulfatase-like hydrolase/transferase [Deltaproteobacteria bacterium]